MIPPFLQAMLQPDFYDPAVEGEIQLLQTHISFVVLAGDLAYKIKKPVKFDFLDYSTPERRKAFCQTELELNRRFSPELYLFTKSIVLRNGRYGLSDFDAADAVDYCVVMRRFSQDALLGNHKTLPVELGAVERFGEHLAAVHFTAPIHRQQGDPAHILKVIDDNFFEMGPFTDSLFAAKDLAELRSFFQAWCADKSAAMLTRMEKGRIRECHGDLHLGNLVALGGEIHAFDGIEFNDSFRIIDVLSDVAFLAMDFDAQGFSEAANRFANAYLERAGDWEGIDVFPLYLAYRAFVRAKIAALTSITADLDEGKKREWSARARHYFSVALRYARRARSLSDIRLTLMHGLSGSGKSTVAKRLAVEQGAILIRSDAVRKHLAGQGLESKGAAADAGLYAADQTVRTYERMNELAAKCLDAGFPVILDARYATKNQRGRALAVARECQAKAEIVVCEASPEELKRRVASRQGDISDATADLIDRQREETEALTPLEQGLARRVES